MRKLIVGNFITLDGYYESKDKTYEPLFDYWLEEYGNNEVFDVYNSDLPILRKEIAPSSPQ